MIIFHSHLVCPLLALTHGVPATVTRNEQDTWELLFQPDCGESSVEFGAGLCPIMLAQPEQSRCLTFMMLTIMGLGLEQAVLVRTETRKQVCSRASAVFLPAWHPWWAVGLR